MSETEGDSVGLLAGKNAIVTGSARGIGKSIVELFAQNGANVWACARRKTDAFEQFANELACQYQVEVTPIYFDLLKADEMRAAIKAIMSTKRRVDVLVNNAGITYNALFQMTTRERLLELFEANFFSQYVFTQYVVKLMAREKSGSIVNIASTAALDGTPGRSAYGASKAAWICATQTLSVELGDYPIRVNAIAPGITQTDMVTESMTNEVVEDTIGHTAMKRIGAPSEIAATALFLASDLSSYVNGQVIRVDGGM